MADISGIVSSGLNLGISTILGGQSQGIGNTINGFINSVTTKLSPTRRIGDTYAKQDLYSAFYSRGDPITNFDWIAVVVNKSVSLNTTMPWYYINNIQMPSPSIGSEEKFIDGRMKKFASIFGVDQCTIRVYSDTTGTAFNFANDWFRCTYRDDNLYQLPSVYKKTIYVFILDVTRQIVVDFQLIGCKPSTWQGYQLGSEGSAALETSLSLDVDDFRVNYDSNPTSIIASVNAAIGNVTGGAVNAVSSAVSGVLSSTLGKISDTLNF